MFASAEPAAPVLSVRGLSRVFNAGTNREVAALKDASFDVFAGEMVAIVGPSGSGKSTLLNLLGLLDSPTSGRYVLAGRDVTELGGLERDLARAGTLGFVFQESYVLADADVAENVALGLRARGTPLRVCRDAVLSAATLVGLEDRVSTPAALLSGGERQRVAIARAVAAGPSVVLADEPTGSLDRKNGDGVIGVLNDLKRGGIAVVVITHDERVAAAADRRIRIEDGHVLAHGALPEPWLGRDLQADTDRHRQFSGALRDAVNTVLLRPWRALALVLAFALGSAGFVSALTLSETAAAQVSTLITTAGLDELRIEGATGTVDQGWLEALERLDHVAGVGVTRSLPAVEYPVTRFRSDAVRGTALLHSATVADAGYLSIVGGHVSPASALVLFSRPGTEHGVIVGNRAAQTLGLSQRADGTQSIWVRNVEYDVLGIVADSERDDALGDKVFIPAIAEIGEPLTYVVRTDPGYPAALAEVAPLALEPGEPEAIKVNTVADLRDLRRGVAGSMGALVGAVSIVLIVMATLGAGATMSASVHARRIQIALRRAVGWSQRAMRNMFLAEGVLLGTLGGCIGSALGVLVAMTVCALMGWVPHLSALGVVVGVLAGPLSGAVAAAGPAIRAANVEPALGLKSA